MGTVPTSVLCFGRTSQENFVSLYLVDWGLGLGVGGGMGPCSG